MQPATAMSDHHRDELMEMAELLLTAGKATGKLTWPSLGANQSRMSGYSVVLSAALSAMNG
jgi:hypothetical protein